MLQCRRKKKGQDIGRFSKENFSHNSQTFIDHKRCLIFYKCRIIRDCSISVEKRFRVQFNLYIVKRRKFRNFGGFYFWLYKELCGSFHACHGTSPFTNIIRDTRNSMLLKCICNILHKLTCQK